TDDHHRERNRHAADLGGRDPLPFAADSLLDPRGEHPGAAAGSVTWILAAYGVAVLLAELAVVLLDARWGLAAYVALFVATLGIAVRTAALGGSADAATDRPGTGAALSIVLVAPPLLRIVA